MYFTQNELVHNLKLSKWNRTGRITQTRSRGLLMSVDLWLEMLN